MEGVTLSYPVLALVVLVSLIVGGGTGILLERSEWTPEGWESKTRTVGTYEPRRFEVRRLDDRGGHPWWQDSENPPPRPTGDALDLLMAERPHLPGTMVPREGNRGKVYPPRDLPPRGSF